MTTLLREVIGDVLRQARLSQGRTLREVSDDARVSLGYLSEVERGRKEASSELLSAICGALEVPLSRVLTDAGETMERRERVADHLAKQCRHRGLLTTKDVVADLFGITINQNAHGCRIGSRKPPESSVRHVRTPRTAESR